MHVMGVRALREKTGELTKNIEAGQSVLITKSGKPLSWSIPFDDELLKSGLHIKMAVQLFEEEILTLTSAAHLAKMPVESFIKILGSLRIPVVDYDEDELELELNLLNEA